VTSLELLSKLLLIMEFHFDLMLCSNLGKENSDAALSNIHVGRIWPAGYRFSTPVLEGRDFQF